MKYRVINYIFNTRKEAREKRYKLGIECEIIPVYSLDDLKEILTHKGVNDIEMDSY